MNAMAMGPSLGARWTRDAFAAWQGRMGSREVRRAALVAVTGIVQGAVCSVFGTARAVCGHIDLEGACAQRVVRARSSAG